MLSEAGDWLVLLGVAACAYAAWKSAARAGRSRAIARVAALFCLALSAFFFYAWYAQYLKWDFNELGRYYDPVDQVVYTDAGFVWVLPAAALLILGLLYARRGWRR